MELNLPPLPDVGLLRDALVAKMDEAVKLQMTMVGWARAHDDDLEFNKAYKCQIESNVLMNEVTGVLLDTLKTVLIHAATLRIELDKRDD